MNILLVSSYLPYPLYSGGHVRLFNIIKHISKRHTITLVCEKRKYQTEDDIAALKRYCKDVVVFDRQKQWSLQNITKTGVSFYPFLLTGHKIPQMQTTIEQMLKEKKFDLIHVETFYVMQNIPQTVIPIILVEHNIEYLVYKRYAQTAPFYLRPFLFIDIAKLRYWEQFFWTKATKLIAVSNEEKQIMGRTDTVVVPNGVDCKQFSFSQKETSKKEKTLLFIGNFTWVQNRDAALFIIKEVFPKIMDTYKGELTLWIVGKHIPETLKKYATKHIFFDENAPGKTSDIFKKADVLLSPIRIGGGTSFKILESMASGIPVITTSLGLEGMEATAGKHMIVADSAQDLASQTILLLNDGKLYKEIARNARWLVEKKFDWNTIVEKLDIVYKEAVKK